MPKTQNKKSNEYELKAQPLDQNEIMGDTDTMQSDSAEKKIIYKYLPAKCHYNVTKTIQYDQHDSDNERNLWLISFVLVVWIGIVSLISLNTGYMSLAIVLLNLAIMSCYTIYFYYHVDNMTSLFI